MRLVWLFLCKDLLLAILHMSTKKEPNEYASPSITSPQLLRRLQYVPATAHCSWGPVFQAFLNGILNKGQADAECMLINVLIHPQSHPPCPNY